MAAGLEAMQALGAFAPAGVRATARALEAARKSFEQGRVPIAGAAVHMDDKGVLSTVAVGCNGRIPERGSAGRGYPTDHGETAAVRAVERFDAVDWSRVVFATTLSPCVLCARTLAELHARGLDKLVVAESETFAGHKERLAGLPGMTLVELREAECVERMRAFARRYPWDWAADVGEVPPRDLSFARAVARDTDLQGDLLARVAAEGAGRAVAGVARVAGFAGFAGFADPLVIARDERADAGGNPTRSAPMLAMGRAGSAVNLRECVLAYCAAEGDAALTARSFGAASLGACELFRPAVLLTDRAPEPGLADALEAADVEVVTA